MRRFFATVLALLLRSSDAAVDHGHHHEHKQHKHHGHHHEHHEHHVKKDDKQHDDILARIKNLEAHLKEKTKNAAGHGHLLVNGPLPTDFAERFSQAVSKATGAPASSVKLTGHYDYVEDAPGVIAIDFEGPPQVVRAVEDEAADPNSNLAKGKLHSFLVAKEDEAAPAEASPPAKEKATPAKKAAPAKAKASPPASGTPASAKMYEVTPIQEKGIDIDTAMPYGDLEPFGREDTAQELTEGSVKESDEMVDQLERAEVAEEKRAVFRALTRLRGAAITSFDGVARSQTGNIDEYNKVHKWRKAHPLHHLADEESDITKWAFPDNADLLQTHHK